MEVYHQVIVFLDNKIMKFNIGTQFSREFSFDDRVLFHEPLNGVLDNFFAKKNYHSEIKTTHISFICVSKGFEPFFNVRPLKHHKKEFAIEYEIKLDFEQFLNSNNDERIKMGVKELLNKSREIFEEKKNQRF
jgi:hypothetical protein